MLPSKEALLEQKLRKHYPESFEIIDDAIKFMIEHNMSFAKGAILKKELYGKTLAQHEPVLDEFRIVLNTCCYAVCTREALHAHLKKNGGYAPCYDVYLFMNKLELDEFTAANDLTKPAAKKYTNLQIYKPIINEAG